MSGKNMYRGFGKHGLGHFERLTQKTRYVKICFTEVLYRRTIFLLVNINIL